MNRDEEIASVQAIYCDELNTFSILTESHLTFRSTPIILSIFLPESYPDSTACPTVSLESNGLGVSRMQLSQLQSHLESIIVARHAEHELMLFDITEETREFTCRLRGDIQVVLDEDEDTWEEAYQDDFDAIDNRVLDNTILKGHMGKTTIESIMSRLSPNLKLLHAEPVLRADLRHRYQLARQRITSECMRENGAHDRRTRDALHDAYAREQVVFHGTMRQHVASIVTSGFVVPGQMTVDGEVVGVRCGSTWGQGIYTSPEPSYSLSYTDYTDSKNTRLIPGQKLIVAAVILGRELKIANTRRLNGEVMAGYHSHISPSGLEYVVFNSAQVLPLYVLHLANQAQVYKPDLGYRISADTRTFENHQAMTDYAKKYLPNGFGPAKGKYFVVEAVADWDDDEEMWGDYQADGGEFQEARWNHNSNTWTNWAQPARSKML